MSARLTQCALFLALSFLSLYATPAWAGAWLQPKGSGQYIVTGYYYTSDEMFNNSGRRVSQPDYTKYEINPYMEYGLSEAVTVGANLSLQHARQDSSGGENSNTSLGDSEFFARGKLWQQDRAMLSATALVKLPGPESLNNAPKIGGRNPDVGFGVSAGYDLGEGALKHFANIDTMYRYRFNSPKDQITVSGTLGWALSPEWMLMPQAFLTYRVGAPNTAAFTQSSSDDYNTVKLQLSAIYQWNDATRLQFGAFSDIDGKNAGVGKGTLFSIWKNF